MINLPPAIELFHFLRPAWLAALPLLGMIWWLVRRQNAARAQWPTEIAPHLLGHLIVNRSSARRLLPVDQVAVVLMLAAVASAGPTWSRLPNPFLAETAPLVVVLEVSETMMANDVTPVRLERAKIKILDLIGRRAGARTGLVAYAGSAHVVLPLTDDPKIVKPFLESLSPSVMPKLGENAGDALVVAKAMLSREDTPGSILFVNDGIDRADISAFEKEAQNTAGQGLSALILGTEAGGNILLKGGRFATSASGRRLSSGVDATALELWRKSGHVQVFRATNGSEDLDRIEGVIQSHFEAALDADDRFQWEDRGWLVIWPALLLGMFWFRRGWTMQWIGVLALTVTVLSPTTSRAEGLLDFFTTADQQGRYAFEQNNFSKAGDLFVDPQWKGTALYRAGRYLEAAEVFARLPSSEALFNLGNALVKGREYGRAISAYEQALADAPDHAAARKNLDIARAIVKRLTRIREEEDTGDQTELGADEYKFDNDTGKGKEIVITGNGKLKIESAEQWMRMVDTRAADFLRTKFALEEARGELKK